MSIINHRGFNQSPDRLCVKVDSVPSLRVSSQRSSEKTYWLSSLNIVPKIHDSLVDSKMKSYFTAKTYSNKTSPRLSSKTYERIDASKESGILSSLTKTSLEELPQKKGLSRMFKNALDLNMVISKSEKDLLLVNNKRSEISVVEHKEMIDRSGLLATKRKKDGETSGSRQVMKPTLPSPGKEISSRKTLTRFIDRMIVRGSLPLEATDYFISENQRRALSQVKLKPLAKKEERLHTVETVQNENKNPYLKTNIDIIPEWMKGIENFNERYHAQQQEQVCKIYEIIKKKPETREDHEEIYAIKWLEKIDLFRKFPYELLLDLSKRLKAVYLDEGQVLCNVGDLADSLYIICVGEIDVLVSESEGERWVVTAKAGELLGRQTLETAGKRTAKLKAAKPTYVIVVFRSDYQAVSGDIKNMIRPAQVISDFVMNHSLLQRFTEPKRMSLMSQLEFRKYYKNDVIYQAGDPSDKIFMLISGDLSRQMPITMEKANKWPTAQKTWNMYKTITTYSIKTHVAAGEIFGITEFIKERPRTEKILAEGDALILTCSRQAFYESEYYLVAFYLNL